ncbi:unnamed protein product [Cylicocyclus nassatus]|uniref:Uncharacterized protein n=1 Tax=Cylicocyclus nassatus TaxID=53992 RepID=A0AA36H7M2_CYLNA|nr:unnamed protein product [Cylicocyclus nassatus]
MLRASRALAQPKTIERLGKAIARSRSNSREPIKEAKTIFSDLPAQLTPSTREAMAVAKEGKKMAASITSPKQQAENAAREENAEKTVTEEKMNEIGTN